MALGLEPGEQPRELCTWTPELPREQACARQKAGSLPTVSPSPFGPVSEEEKTEAQGVSGLAPMPPS